MAAVVVAPAAGQHGCQALEAYGLTVNERHMTDRQPDPPGDAKRPRPAVNLTGPSRTAQHPQRVRRITFPAVPLRLRCRGKCGEMTSQQSLIHAKRRRPGGWTAPFAPHRSRHKALARVWRSRQVVYQLRPTSCQTGSDPARRWSRYRADASATGTQFPGGWGRQGAGRLAQCQPMGRSKSVERCP